MAVPLAKHLNSVEKMRRRHVLSTDHPQLFTVIGTDGEEHYRVIVIPAFGTVPLSVLCSCEWGLHAGLVPADKVACWHGKLVIQRRFSGGSKSVRG